MKANPMDRYLDLVKHIIHDDRGKYKIATPGEPRLLSIYVRCLVIAHNH